MRRLLTSLAVLGACAAAVFLVGASGDEEGGKTFKIEFDNAFGLTEGGDLRVGGVKAGQTKSFSITDGEPPKAVVEAEITVPGFESFREDATCESRPQSLIGEYYVDCQPGTDPQKLPDGGRIPVTQTASTIPFDLVNNVLRRPYRERLRLLISELGTGLAGRPDELRAVLRRAHPALRETNKTLAILAGQTKIIEDFITDSDVVVAELAQRKRDVARWVVEASQTAEISASRREDIAGTFRRFPGFLDELRPTMVRLGQLADEQTPLLQDLQAAAGSLDTFFTELGPFSQASLPSIRSLGQTSRVGSEALRESREEIDELRRLADKAPEFAKPLRQILVHIDDRNFSFEPDPRAAETAPPAPDPTSDAKGKGFTGMESLWNYFYFQTLAINQFDEVSHVLRALLFPNDCSKYSTTVNETTEKCAAWLGPYQPGLKNPDPTESGVRAREDRERADAKKAREGERVAGQGETRGPGEPEAPPVPGERDPSKPRLVLPPQIQELRDKLPKLGGGDPEVPGVRGGEEQLLDFLLAP